jgi:chorismate mutase
MDMATAAAVREIVVTANEEALNTAITENQIQPEKIISVVFEPRRDLATGDHEAKYRVLYPL